jgi:hypothetical protein
MARGKASQITEVREGFQVNSTVKKRLRNSKRRISIKAWLALLQPKAEHRQTLLGMEFKQFLVVWMTLPCQIVSSGRAFVFRLLAYNAWVPVLLATVDLLRNLSLN